MFKAARDPQRRFVALGIGVVVVSDTRTLETDTAGALLKSACWKPTATAPPVASSCRTTGRRSARR
jgi:molybdopterin biosynthesis enzyme MoaB